MKIDQITLEYASASD